jgi:hypothetical protein
MDADVTTIASAIATLHKALAEQQAEPAAWCRLAYNTDGSIYVDNLTFTKDHYCNVPLYAYPPAQQPLTDDQINYMAAEYGDELDHAFIFNREGRFSAAAFARAAIAKATGETK